MICTYMYYIINSSALMIIHVIIGMTKSIAIEPFNVCCLWTHPPKGANLLGMGQNSPQKKKLYIWHKKVSRKFGVLGPKLWVPYVKMWWYHARVWQRRIYVLAILGAWIKNHSPHMSSLAWYMYVNVNIIQYLHMCIAVMKSPRSVSLQLVKTRETT